jgi:hypothetical protein
MNMTKPPTLALKWAISAAFFAQISACSWAEPDRNTEANTAPLKIDPNYAGDAAEPARSYTLFEADPVRPIALLEKSGLSAVVNTRGDSLDLVRIHELSGGPGHTNEEARSCASIHVGMRPVAVATVSETPASATLWVVNHLSDSVSIVQVDTARCQGEVVETVYVGDEPRDIVVVPQMDGAPRVFVATAHRGQHHPVESARSGQDLVIPPSEKAEPGLADVFVFDANAPKVPLQVVNLFTDTPRALAVHGTTVYAAGFRTGNGTTIVPANLAAEVGLESLSSLLLREQEGNFVERDGRLLLSPGVRGRSKIRGGMPAVVGMGRCLPDPRPESKDEFTQGVCVKTDRQHRVLSATLVKPGVLDESCQCTSGDGTPQPTVGVLVKFSAERRLCGAAYETFPDGTRGCWLDAAHSGARTPAAHADEQAPAMAWNEQVKLSLPDEDVFAIDSKSLAVTRAFSGVGTVVFGMAANPVSGDLLVLNTDAQNLTRFEGVGEHASTTVRGHLYESRVTLIQADGRVRPMHLNTHIDYAKCCDRNSSEAEKSLAFPTSGVFSPDGRYFYMTLLGSDKVVRLESQALSGRFDNERARKSGALTELFAGEDVASPAGPVGVTLSSDGETLYVKTHFTNELLSIHASTGELLGRAQLHSPEPESVSKGRSVLYNARLTSAHGDSACASCHIFGDLDSTAWDLGDPDGSTVRNPGPFSVPPELASAESIALDPLAKKLDPDFRSNKGPMATQTLRGMANQGAQHWRGDRTRRFQDVPGAHPNTGSLDENNSFNEFDVAIFGLNGNDTLLDPETFQDFTNFALQLTLPPNPVRHLDNTLTPDQAAGRALFFGCSSMTDDEFSARTCSGRSQEAISNVDAETKSCACYSNPLVRAMDQTSTIVPLAQTVSAVLRQSEVRTSFLNAARDVSGLPSDAQPSAEAMAAQLEMAVLALIAASFEVDAKKLVRLPDATALAQATGALLGLVQLSERFGTPTGANLLQVLWSALPAEARAPGTPFESPEGFARALPDTFVFANLAVRVQIDEQARGTGAFRDVLLGCEIGVPRSCALRESDSLHTCHGCHTLDPRGNSEFDVYRPGFFGTSGTYSFENESQFMKVPHLRNLYQKAGMFGSAKNSFALNESALGPRKGGFFVADNSYQGPQVRGFGFMHDGEMETTHRFFSGLVFAARPFVGGLDTGNPDAFEAVLPRPETMDSCVHAFRGASLDALPELPPEAIAALGFCGEGSGLPDSCFLQPSDAFCQAALEAVAEALQDPEFPRKFEQQIRPACFQLGSTLEGGDEDGVCAPAGLRERSQVEAFMMAFDTNLKPMVGQQVTVRRGSTSDPLFRDMVRVSARGDCDIVAFQGDRGFVMTSPEPSRPDESELKDLRGRARTLRSLLVPRQKALTLTCYPPQPGRAEAWAQLREL